MNEFSIPMVYNKELIDKICELNNSLNKSKIVSFYDGLPENSNFLTGLEQSRGPNLRVNNLYDFTDYVKYVIDKGFKFIYLFNTTYPINMKNPMEHRKITNNIDILIKKLNYIGCNTVRVGNTSTIQYLSQKYPDLEIIASTVLGYTNITQYRNITEIYPRVKEFCLHYDNNHNFKLLKNLVQKFPDIKKELMVNELCIKSCPLRNSHYSILYPQNSPFVSDCIRGNFLENCDKVFKKDFWLSVCRSNIIYPWHIEAYSEAGINNFKFIGRFYDDFLVNNILTYISDYLRAVDDRDFMLDMEFFRFYNDKYIYNHNGLKVRDIIDYLPDINHFVKAGHLCDSICEMECNYCNEKAKTLNELFPIENYISR